MLVAQHQEPRAGTEPPNLSALSVPGFGAQFGANLRRNFTTYNRAPGKSYCACVCVGVWVCVGGGGEGGG